jgi:uncharacterized membrane protein (UPF0182 family)
MKINIEKINGLSFDELILLRNEVDIICKGYANTLTTYAVTHNDPYFNDMDKDMVKSYERRNDFAKLLIILNRKVENKIYEDYIEDK